MLKCLHCSLLCHKRCAAYCLSQVPCRRHAVNFVCVGGCECVCRGLSTAYCKLSLQVFILLAIL